MDQLDKSEPGASHHKAGNSDTTPNSSTASSHPKSDKSNSSHHKSDSRASQQMGKTVSHHKSEKKVNLSIMANLINEKNKIMCESVPFIEKYTRLLLIQKHAATDAEKASTHRKSSGSGQEKTSKSSTAEKSKTSSSEKTSSKSTSSRSSQSTSKQVLGNIV